MATLTKKIVLFTLGGVILGVVITLLLGTAGVQTSTNESCSSCHVHPESEASWKKSVHFDNRSGTVTDCVACHLPPK